MYMFVCVCDITILILISWYIAEVCVISSLVLFPLELLLNKEH